MIVTRTRTQFDQRHGGPYDRGSADSYYGRDYCPHYFVGDTYSSAKVEMAQMTSAEIVAYTAGFNGYETIVDKKL